MPGGPIGKASPKHDLTEGHSHHEKHTAHDRPETLGFRDRRYQEAVRTSEYWMFAGSTNLRRIENNDSEKRAFLLLNQPGDCVAVAKGTRKDFYIYWGAMYVPIDGYSRKRLSEDYWPESGPVLALWQTCLSTSPEKDFGRTEFEDNIEPTDFCFIACILKLSEDMRWSALVSIPVKHGNGWSLKGKTDTLYKVVKHIIQMPGQVSKKCALQFFDQIPNIYLRIGDYGDLHLEKEARMHEPRRGSKAKEQ